MKNLIKKVGLIAIASVLVFATACKKDSQYVSAVDYINDITGTYDGNFVKNGIVDQDSASAEIIQVNGNEIQIHCYNANFDTTFVMDIYANYDSIMVCANGENFESMYGHGMQDGHMGDMMGGQNEWSHHMNDSHLDGEQHFGGFNMTNHSFGYTFRINGSSTNIIEFEGTKIN